MVPLLLLLLLLPMQVLRIVTLGNADSKGGFFPNGVNGKINSTAGYTDAANAFGGYPGNQVRGFLHKLQTCSPRLQHATCCSAAVQLHGEATTATR